MTSRLSIFIGCIFFVLNAKAQIGGKSVFGFLNLAPTARATAVGNGLLVVREDDLGLGLVNPSLLNPQNHQSLTFNHEFYPAKIQHGYFGYGHYVNKWKTTFQGGIQYMNYGTFTLADEYGNQLGNFKSNEVAFLIGAGYQLSNRLSVGSNLKFVTSNLESYSANALALDLAATYYDTSSRLGLTFLMQNIGSQLGKYNIKENIPYNVSIAISKKLKYLPLRWMITMHDLNRWNMLYDDPNADGNILFNGNETQTTNQFSTWTDNFFRHFTFGGEFLFGKKEVFRVRFGYNHQKRKEFSVANYRSLAGFSGGFGITIKQFRLDYGFAKYHLAGGTNQISISTNLNRFRR